MPKKMGIREAVGGVVDYYETLPKGDSQRIVYRKIIVDFLANITGEFLGDVDKELE